MKTRYHFLLFLCLCAACLCGSCTDDVEEELEGKLTFTDNEVTLDASAGSQVTFAFTSTLDWQATVSGSWLSVSPSGGGAGSHELTLTARTANTADSDRVATLTLVSGSQSHRITVRQSSGNYAQFTQDVYTPSQDGGLLEIYFHTNMAHGDFAVEVQRADWLTDHQDTRVVEYDTYVVRLDVAYNREPWQRSAYVYLVELLPDGSTGRTLDQARIVQDGSLTNMESTDYSQDGKSRPISLHTRGKGIPILFMGEGFLDQQISDNYYDAVMETGVDRLFSEEPLASLRSYFDIYMVWAVSRHNRVGEEGFETAFGCKFADNGSTRITGDDDAVMDYVQKCADQYGFDPYEALAVVLIGSSTYAGTTYYGYLNPSTDHRSEFAIAYCPLVDGVDGEMTRRVLVHEAVGHGFAKLLDEYSYEENGTIPAAEVLQNQALQRDLGWSMNVDFTDDRSKVLWADFLSDERYAGQGLGVIEGACSYTRGAYRSTVESMMRNNIQGFNAPSRRAIYNRTIKSGEGRLPTYEEFVTFDRQTFNPLTRSQSALPSPLLAAPCLVDRVFTSR